MFLHSGASLHGHEYSNTKRPPTPRRNPLLRSAFASTPINRVYTYTPDSTRSTPSPAPPLPRAATHSLKRVRPISEYTPKHTEPVVRFQEPVEDEPTTTRLESMSGDEGSIEVSDSDMSTSTATRRRRRRMGSRNSISYALCQPPPKLGNKQRILHIRPKLLLQMQQVHDDGRPRPIIDIYPSSAIANSAIAVSLLKRVPRLARIKRQLGIQDIMLVKSEDYNTGVESDSEGDEDNIKKRDLAAIISPLPSQDKADIVLIDGTVWLATPRISGTSCIYEFETVDSVGRKTVARWVRRQVVTKSAPSTPTATPNPHSTVDYKFTFSIIDPAHRRHPIMATLKSNSLEVQDTYTTVSQSSGRYPPTNPMLGPTPSSSPQIPSFVADDEVPSERTTLKVEEWHKSFIQASAVYVVFRHGWFPHARLGGLVPPSGTAASAPQIMPVSRTRSYSASTDNSPKLPGTDSAAWKNCASVFTANNQSAPGLLPRRATSSGAVFMQKRRAQRSTTSTASDMVETETESVERKSRRPLSGDWNVNVVNRLRDSSLVRMVASDRDSKSTAHSRESSTWPQPSRPALAVSGGRRTVSEYYPQNPLLSEFENEPIMRPVLAPNPLYVYSDVPMEPVDYQYKHSKHHRWRSVASWFNKLKAH